MLLGSLNLDGVLLEILIRHSNASQPPFKI